MEPRDWFELAATGYVRVVERIESHQLTGPGLGEWDLLALLGHSSRAFSTIESYLSDSRDAPSVSSASEYFIRVRASLADSAAVALRGRQAGQALGQNPTAEVERIAERVRSLVARSDDDASVLTPVGVMRLVDYLPTRAFELTVHGIDLAQAIGCDIPDELGQAAHSAIDLAAAIADTRQRVDLLLAATGRKALPQGFSVL